MKSNALRQRELRRRRNETGSFKQLNIWISAEALEALSSFAAARQVTQRRILETLILNGTRTTDTSALAELTLKGRPAPPKQKRPAQTPINELLSLQLDMFDNN